MNSALLRQHRHNGNRLHTPVNKSSTGVSTACSSCWHSSCFFDSAPPPPSPNVLPSPRSVFFQQEDVLDFDGDEEEEEEEAAAAAKQAKFRPATPPPTPSVRVLSPWIAPPETEAAARVRLSLYFALCVKSRPMLSGLLEAYVTAAPPAQAGLLAELPLLAKAAAKGFGEPGVVGLVAAAPEGARALVLAMLDLLVPWDTNKPSPEIVAAVRRLRDKRVASEAAGDVKVEKVEGGESSHKVRRLSFVFWAFDRITYLAVENGQAMTVLWVGTDRTANVWKALYGYNTVVLT